MEKAARFDLRIEAAADDLATRESTLRESIFTIFQVEDERETKWIATRRFQEKINKIYKNGFQEY